MHLLFSFEDIFEYFLEVTAPKNTRTRFAVFTFLLNDIQRGSLTDSKTVTIAVINEETRLVM